MKKLQSRGFVVNPLAPQCICLSIARLTTQFVAKNQRHKYALLQSAGLVIYELGLRVVRQGLWTRDLLLTAHIAEGMRTAELWAELFRLLLGHTRTCFSLYEIQGFPKSLDIFLFFSAKQQLKFVFHFRYLDNFSPVVIR